MTYTMNTRSSVLLGYNKAKRCTGSIPTLGKFKYSASKHFSRCSLFLITLVRIFYFLCFGVDRYEPLYSPLHVPCKYGNDYFRAHIFLSFFLKKSGIIIKFLGNYTSLFAPSYR
ncbi:hypothetical protein BGZ63DRAFT_76700 [Mariannaea sp. PMI_226]|nr:hypothetical protein BGZ63DRAFT_76700 [Mariannaea sp. PMI_226]